MAISQGPHFILFACLVLSLFILTDSLGTFFGHRKIHERRRRAAAGYPVGAAAQARYNQQGYPAAQNTYQQNSYRNPQQTYGQSAGAYPQTVPSQYQANAYPTAALGGATGYRQNAQSSVNPAYSASALYGANPQYAGSTSQYPAAQQGINGQYGAVQPGYNVRPTQSAYPASNPAASSYSYPSGAYPVAQNNFNPVAGQNGYPAAAGYQQGNPQQYNFNGYNPYGNNQQQGYGNNAGYVQGRSAAAAASAPKPLVVAPPTAPQYTLSEFCKQPDREPKCAKNTFGMCASDENYPSEVASEFYGYYKSRITAMATDYDYSNSDQYDTGFATQQNKLIDFVHEIFDDNEYGNLPGVPPVKKGLCTEASEIMQPGWAKTSRGKYTVIMNSNTIKQSVRAGMCKNAGKGCQDVPKCYKSECRQRFRYDTLLVFDPCDAKKPPMLELFKIPDGCECFVLQEEPDLTAPISTSATPSSTSVDVSQQVTKQSAKGRSGDFAAAALLKAVNEAGTSTRVSTAAPSTTTKTTAAMIVITPAATTVTTAPTTLTTPPSTTPATTTPATTTTTTEASAGIPPRSSLVLAPRVVVSIPGSSSSEILQAL